MSEFGVTNTGFVLKRMIDIRSSIANNLSLVQDPVTGETLTPDLNDENDPLVQVVNSVSDELSVCWEQLQACYNQMNPNTASGVGLSGNVQLCGITRNPGESDTQLRVRRQLSTSLTSSAQVDSIFAAVINVPGVVFCKVNQNVGMVADANGAPAKTLYVVVVGGDDQAVANAIFTSSPALSQYYGTTTKTCYDVNDTPYEVKFTRPTPVPITALATIHIIDAAVWPNNGESIIKSNIVNYANYGLSPRTGIPPGMPVYNSRLTSPINDVPGHVLVNLQLKRGAGALAIQDIPIAWNEVASLSVDNITVVPS